MKIPDPGRMDSSFSSFSSPSQLITPSQNSSLLMHLLLLVT
jgi:hypothetical protein